MWEIRMKITEKKRDKYIFVDFLFQCRYIIKKKKKKKTYFNIKKLKVKLIQTIM